MAPLSVKKLKISVLVLSLLFVLTWGILSALVLINHLPGYIRVIETGSLPYPLSPFFPGLLG